MKEVFCLPSYRRFSLADLSAHMAGENGKKSNSAFFLDPPVQLLTTSISGVGSESEVEHENKDGDTPH